MARSILKESVYEGLRQRILSGELRAGATLGEVQLAAEMKVSRTPVREAIRQLADEGFVEYWPHRGGRVLTPSPELAAEIFQIREALEGIAAREAARRMPQECIQLLRSHFESIRPAITAGDYTDVGDVIHQRVLEHTSNKRLERLTGIYRGQVVWLQLTATQVPGRMSHAFREHDAILTALESRDPEWAESAMRAHVRNTLADLLTALIPTSPRSE